MAVRGPDWIAVSFEVPSGAAAGTMDATAFPSEELAGVAAAERAEMAAATGSAETEVRAAVGMTDAPTAETGREGMADGADMAVGLAEMAVTVGIAEVTPFERRAAAPAAVEAPPLTGAEMLTLGVN